MSQINKNLFQSKPDEQQNKDLDDNNIKLQ